MPIPMVPRIQGTEPGELEQKIEAALAKAQELAHRRGELARDLAQTEELLARWDARLVTLRELQAEGFSRILKAPEAGEV